MQLFTKTQNELKNLGAAITTQEIMQQPGLWEEALVNYQDEKNAIDSFLHQIKKETSSKQRVVFTG